MLNPFYTCKLVTPKPNQNRWARHLVTQAWRPVRCHYSACQSSWELGECWQILVLLSPWRRSAVMASKMPWFISHEPLLCMCLCSAVCVFFHVSCFVIEAAPTLDNNPLVGSVVLHVTQLNDCSCLYTAYFQLRSWIIQPSRKHSQPVALSTLLSRIVKFPAGPSRSVVASEWNWGGWKKHGGWSLLSNVLRVVLSQHCMGSNTKSVINQKGILQRFGYLWEWIS